MLLQLMEIANFLKSQTIYHICYDILQLELSNLPLYRIVMVPSSLTVGSEVKRPKL